MTLFKTSQVAWRTKIPVGTMQRYIRDYAEFFSKGASVPNKSRRYTEDDVQKLLIVRELNRAHANEVDIRAALSGEIPSAELPFSEFESVVQIAEAARQAKVDAEKSAARARQHLLDMEDRLKRYTRQMFETREDLQKLATLVNAYTGQLNVVLDAMESEGLIEKVKRAPTWVQASAIPESPTNNTTDLPQIGIDWLDRVFAKFDEKLNQWGADEPEG
jgi:DNA-binding transcriptional MerR regulator